MQSLRKTLIFAKTTGLLYELMMLNGKMCEFYVLHFAFIKLETDVTINYVCKLHLDKAPRLQTLRTELKLSQVFALSKRELNDRILNKMNRGSSDFASVLRH